MQLDHDAPMFDLGDQTALVCIDHQQFQKMVVPQLIDLQFKVHLGLFEEDVLLKLRTYAYDVVVIYENFKNSTLKTNPILVDMTKRSGTQRRQHFVILLSHRLATNDAMAAFAESVDQIINVADLANFKPVVRRGVAQYRDLYQPFLETIKAVLAA